MYLYGLFEIELQAIHGSARTLGKGKDSDCRPGLHPLYKSSVDATSVRNRATPSEENRYVSEAFAQDATPENPHLLFTPYCITPYLGFHRVKQTGFLDQLVEEAFAADERRWGVEFRNRTVVEDDDAIGIEDCVDTMSNRDDSPIPEHTATQGALEQSIRLNVNRSLLPRQPKFCPTCQFCLQ